MNEQNNSALEQAEQPTAEEKAADQSVDDVSINEPVKPDAEEQVNYKAELEKANSRIKELELECDAEKIKKEWLIAEGSEKNVISKAHDLVKQGFAKDVCTAVGMLEQTMPDVIKRNVFPKFSFCTNNGQSFGDRKESTAFSKGFTGNKFSDMTGTKKEW